MALWDFLKRKKEIEKSKEGRKPAKRAVNPLAAKKTEEKPVAEKKPSSAKTVSKQREFSYSAIKQPHISEKSTDLSQKNQYIFKVAQGFNKNQIKNAVEGVYGVDVLSVRVVKIPAKKRRLGKTQGYKKGLNKAIVKIKENQKIEIL